MLDKSDPVMTTPEPKAGIWDIAAYIGGKSHIAGISEPIKLSSNENALGCSPQAMSAYVDAQSRLFRYPDPMAAPLRAAVATHYDLEPERLLFGNGSDEVFTFLNQTYLEVGDNVVTGEHGFLAYRISALACQADLRLVAEPERRIDINALLSQCDERTKFVYISNPANPTGTWNTLDEIAELRARLASHTLLVIDEAYAEYVTQSSWQSAMDMARGTDNMVVTRTFSKIYGLAGLRIGFGYCPAKVIEAVERIRLPFNTSIPAQMAAVAALKDQDHVAASKAQVSQWKPRLIQAIRGMGYRVDDGAGNFILIDFATQSICEAANEHLMHKGLIVRHVANYGLASCLRVTIGKDHEMQAFLEALAQFKA